MDLASARWEVGHWLHGPQHDSASITHHEDRPLFGCLRRSQTVVGLPLSHSHQESGASSLRQAAPPRRPVRLRAPRQGAARRGLSLPRPSPGQWDLEAECFTLGDSSATRVAKAAGSSARVHPEPGCVRPPDTSPLPQSQLLPAPASHGRILKVLPAALPSCGRQVSALPSPLRLH